ncbi:MAG TPA: cupin domain-containing protein [Vicinamibacterales bacterium]|nr:cupin domain-containing protein [Vicinamibacterales bacterium]
MRTRMLVLAAAMIAAAVTTGVHAGQTAPPTFTRTVLQDQDISAKDRHGVMSRSEFMPGASSGRHFHPGEEFGYVLEGTLELTVDGKPPQRLKAGDVIYMPAGTIHDARNVGPGTLKVLSTYVLEKGKPLATAVK